MDYHNRITPYLQYLPKETDFYPSYETPQEYEIRILKADLKSANSDLKGEQELSRNLQQQVADQEYTILRYKIGVRLAAFLALGVATYSHWPSSDHVDKNEQQAVSEPQNVENEGTTVFLEENE